jgi:hypothetical protein
MSKALFQQLCDDVSDAVSEDEFKSKQYIQQQIDSASIFQDHSNNIFIAHHDSTGGFVLGKVKLAITLCILGGASYLDVSLFFEVSFNHAHNIVANVVDVCLLVEICLLTIHCPILWIVPVLLLGFGIPGNVMQCASCRTAPPPICKSLCKKMSRYLWLNMQSFLSSSSILG